MMQTKKRINVYALAVLVIVAAALIAWLVFRDSGSDGAAILSTHRAIAHALGVSEDGGASGCLEAFENTYASGTRIFEVDLLLTSDGKVVVRHDWNEPLQEGIDGSHIPTLETFLSTPIRGKYTPLSFKDLLLLMEEHPDICIVTDTKYFEEADVVPQFEAMVAEAEELGLTHLFDRVYIQLYNDNMYDVVESVYHFPHYIYTLYVTGFLQTEWAFTYFAEFCHKRGIEGITMWYYWWDEAYAPIAEKNGVKVFVHTVNDAEAARGYLAEGVSGIYTDSLTEAELAK